MSTSAGTRAPRISSLSQPSVLNKRPPNIDMSTMNQSSGITDISNQPSVSLDVQNAHNITLTRMMSTPEIADQNFDHSHVYSAMRDEQNGVKVMDRRYGFRVYSKCFVGSEAVTWISKYTQCSRQKAIKIGQQLMDVSFLYHVCEDHCFKDDYLFYRFREDDPRDSKVLNRRLIWPRTGRGQEALLISTKLLSEMIKICKFHQAIDSSEEIEIEDVQSDERFMSLRNDISELQTVNISAIKNVDEKIAFLVNCHNLLYMHARIQLGPVSIAKTENAYFDMLKKLRYDIGGNLFGVNHLRYMLCNSGDEDFIDTSQSAPSNFMSLYTPRSARPKSNAEYFEMGPELWRPHIYFVLSDGSKGSAVIAPNPALTPKALRKIAHNHLQLHLIERGKTFTEPFAAFVKASKDDDPENVIQEMLNWIDEITNRLQKHPDIKICTSRVLQLRRLLKGKTVSLRNTDRNFAPILA